MRHVLSPLCLCVLALTGCGATMAQSPALSGQASAQAMPAAPFSVPMDPGTISCTNLSPDQANPAALRTARDWATGQARAAVMAGRASGPVEPASIAAGLIQACATTLAATVAQATRAMGY